MLRAAVLAAALALVAPSARVVGVGQTVRGPLVERGRDVLVRGRVVGDVTVSGGNVAVDRSGEVTGNILVTRGDVILANGARVRGTVRFSAGRPRKTRPSVPPSPDSGEPAANDSPTAVPSGADRPPADGPAVPGRLPAWLWATSRLGLAAGLLACLVLLQVLFPYRFRRASETTSDRPVHIALVGCLAAISVTALAAALFMLTQSLAGTVLALLLLGPPTLVGLATAVPALGRRALPPRWQDGGGTAAALAGGLLWEATLMVPILGWLLAGAIVIWGLGAFVCSFRSTYPLPGTARFPIEDDALLRR